ncbi:tRNA (adenine(22)-N(1))-methyltransferase [Lacrimispora indolis]|uniref:tRNA (adenine(22)-N(1))-methyltransferase n=1 Tax=Lacrimispora indolis TaxID=69825 RepID=UPI0004216FDC|nr:class I SAM-dependent methyltransferase [[Clostridium] methoxybenzovorans]
MKLSRRLETIASFVPEGSRVADIGTDHGYIPIHLVQEGKAKHAIAMDVREGPLLRARAHIQEAGLQNYVEVRLSDGLLKLEQNEADCVVIAGMGGELMIHILEGGRDLWESISCWVLSPHSELDKVRRFLEEEAFFIWRETMIKEEGKYYSVMGVSRKPGAAAADGREFFYRYGRGLLESKDPVLKEYLIKEEEQLEQIMSGLSVSETESARRRMEELKLELAYNKEAQDAMR